MGPEINKSETNINYAAELSRFDEVFNNCPLKLQKGIYETSKYSTIEE